MTYIYVCVCVCVSVRLSLGLQRREQILNSLAEIKCDGEFQKGLYVISAYQATCSAEALFKKLTTLKKTYSLFKR